MTNSEIVLAFIDAWNRNDAEAAIAFLTDDVCYHNIPMPVLNGIEAVRQFFVEVGDISETDWKMIPCSQNAWIILNSTENLYRCR